MRNRIPEFLGKALVVIFLLSLHWSASACQVPVFRYALERWPPDAYQVLIYHQDPLSEETKKVADWLSEQIESQTHPANLAVTLVNLAREEDQTLLNIHQKLGGGSPLMVLFYPPYSGIGRPIWSGPASLETAQSIVDSPVRREIMKKLITGDSAVWVLVESGQKDKDDSARTKMTEFLSQIQGELELPEGVIGASSEPLDPSGFGAFDFENMLRSNIPLKIAFSLVSVGRQEAQEDLFLGMLLNLEDDLSEFEAEPIVFPVFGRGRALFPLIGKGLTLDNTMEFAAYLCGACSCQVKSQNPGVDLLFALNWDAAIGDEQFVVDKELPPLIGIDELVAKSETEMASATPNEDPSPDPLPIEPSSAEPMSETGQDSQSGMRMTLPLTIGGFIALILGLTLFMWKSRP